MCEPCAALGQLLLNCEARLYVDVTQYPPVRISEVEVVAAYLNAWPQRQCLCCYRDPKNFDRFNLLIQSILHLAICQLRILKDELVRAKNRNREDESEAIEVEKASESRAAEDGNGPESSDADNSTSRDSFGDGSARAEEWTPQQRERLVRVVGKIFQVNFPLYVACKHSPVIRLDDVSAQEIAALNCYCDLHDTEVPVYLLRNVNLFCKTSGINIMGSVFEHATPETLPMSMAHAIVSAVSDLKMWLNYRAVAQLFMPMRNRALKYMRSLEDKDLRLSDVKNMADFMWGAAKDPLDAPIIFDRDGLDLAFKYFNSTTLTMRLAGIAQINAQISVFNDMCAGEVVPEAETVGQQLAQWLCDNQIMEHLFGPNLHVEIIKQAHIILKFLAVENRITEEHIELLWQASQLKHCSKQVHDLFSVFIKSLAAGPCSHLYKLLCSLPLKEHTEQSLSLASSLIRIMWSRSSLAAAAAALAIGTLPSSSERAAMAEDIHSRIHSTAATAGASCALLHHHDTSSEASVSLDPTNSDEDPCEELSTSGDEIGPTPRKQPKPPTVKPADEEKWINEDEEKKSDVTLKTSKRLKEDGGGTSGSVSSGAEDTNQRPLKKKILRKRKNTKRALFGDISKVEIGELMESISDVDETSGSESELCTIPKTTALQRISAARERADPALMMMKHSERSLDVACPQASVHDCSPLCDSMDARQIMEMMSGDDGEASLSSAMSNKSDKNMADFDGEESGYEELARLAAATENMGYYRVSGGIGSVIESGYPGGINFQGTETNESLCPRGHHPDITDCHSIIHKHGDHKEVQNLHFNLKLEEVCKPGNTLLWDLLQDENIRQLGEDLALEAEKAFYNLLGYNVDKYIRLKFIEGCLDNLNNHRSVAVSLRLLPKLFSSFQQLRGMDMHQVVMWAEKEHKMMQLFFNDLKHYMLNYNKTSTLKNVEMTTNVHGQTNQSSYVPPLFSHMSEVTVRLQFLTTIFSPIGSPTSFRLTMEQVDTLWTCLVNDGECADCLFSWLLSHAKSTDQHALGMDTLKYLYTEKMPTLNPETLSLMGLSLYQQLISLARMALGQANIDTRDQNHPHVLAMDHLWKIALKANNTDVSTTAIQYLNSYYIGQHLQQEEEFISQCMFHLDTAAAGLTSSTSKSDECGDSQPLNSSKSMIIDIANDEASLQCIQRALLLLKTHLDTFKRRYAYHLRMWSLTGNSVCGSNVEGIPLKVIIQPGAINMKTTFQMFNTDYIADLRAQVTFWWEQIQNEEGSASFADGPIRMLTQGQELVVDYDERTLYDMGFKDNHVVLISVGMSGARNRGSSNAWGDWPSQQPPPPRELLPTLLLLKRQYFDRLFALMQTLGEMTMPGSNGERIAHMKAQLLSRRVWDILHAVPLCPSLLSAFQNPVESRLPDLLNPASPQRLMYSLHIVDKLSALPEVIAHPHSKCSGLKSNMLRSQEEEEGKETWAQLFIKNGGLRHLFDIFMSGVLQSEDGEENEWRQDCLVVLLKLIGHLGTVSNNKNHTSMKNQDAPTIPLLHESLLSLMEVDSTTKRLMSILTEAARHRDPSLYKTGFSGRSNVVQHCMWLLVCWVHSWSAAAANVVCSPSISGWLSRLLLEDPQPQVRRETCSALYRLCLGGSSQTSTSSQSSNRNSASNITIHVVPAILRHLLEHLPRAESMRPSKIELMHHPAEEGKEPYGPACRDYFWLVCRLVDGLPTELVKENGGDESSGLDLNNLCSHLSDSVCAREIIEKRLEPSVPDDGLFGQINLLTHLLKHPLAFKTSDKGKKLIDSVFGFLFDVANPTERCLPKCKSQKSRAAAYDLLIELVKGAPENYTILHHKLMDHHRPGLNATYPWDYWPSEEGRSECGYVGLTNLGATCYMASCMQHLYMMPQARAAILRADPTKSKHKYTLIEMQRMFAYLLESERKSYNPRSFCKVYQMDHQPLNTGEQKDMAEFFINLVSKLEEMTPELKTFVKTMFGGIISNNVVSLDCSHVSRTLEEFYTVRCQVADMRNLYQSLNEVTVKDTLEGDNCYTCSQCSAKVRAEKRACFKKLPRILCFNTMRYTFNMVTMLKEKVNTHFSFPMHLDMSGYVEKYLMPTHYQEEKKKSEMKKDSNDDEFSDNDFDENYDYDLIGVTVHTGTADGGHYYSFIKERNGAVSNGSNMNSNEKWFLFNDAEVKPFDPAQIPAECFGGEMTSKTYDSVTDKFMDFSFEKTNSAYMLFYERDYRKPSKEGTSQTSSTELVEQPSSQKCDELPPIVLSPTLQKWIWDDNMIFLHHKNIFQHAYFTFMGQMCSYVPQSLLTLKPEITQVAAQLSTSFFIETFIHAKEKPTMVSWIELVTKQFNASAAASEWFLEHMAEDMWWPMQVLIKCPNQMVRQMFQRLCIHVIQRLRSSHCSLYLQGCDDVDDIDGDIGEASCVTRFIKILLGLMENGAKAHLRHLTEYFGLLFDFSRMGEEESQFLLKANAISMMVSFYLGHTSTSTVDGSSSDEGSGDKLKPAALDKMVALVAGLVEKSRDSQRSLNLTSRDQHALQGGKGFPFLYQQTRDCLNLQQTKTLIHAMCRWNERLAQHIISMIFQAITKHTESCQPFFKLLTLLVEGGGASGLPCFTQLALNHVWEATESCPHAAIEWLSLQVPRNKMVHTCVLQTAESWIETYLMGHPNQRVRSAASFLLISLVPSAHFRQSYRSNMRCLSVHKDVILSEDAMVVLHQVYTLLLEKLKAAKKYTDVSTHGHMKLTAYFGVLSYCLVSRIEKVMFGQYFQDLWDLFHPGMSEPAISVYPNKQALLSFWYAAVVDCPENIQLIVSNPVVSKHIAYNYILADHDDGEVIAYNRVMLPSYYAILRLCCQASQAFTRTLSQHQNIHWAFKNITPHPGLYSAAIEELFKLMQLFATRSGDSSEQELREINSFRRNILATYLQGLNGRNCWTTLISAFKTLVETDDDRLYIVYNGGLQMAFEALHNLHTAYHDVGGGPPVVNDLRDLLSLTIGLCRSLRSCRDCKEARAAIHACKDWPEVPRRLVTLLNTYNPKEIRNLSIDLIKEMLLLLGSPTLSVLVPLFAHCHISFQDSRSALPLGPYFPVRGMIISSSIGEPKINQAGRSFRPLLQMCIPHAQLQARNGVDPEYDEALRDFYLPYHSLLDAMCRLGVERGCCSSQLLNLACRAALEAVPLRFTLFPTLWHEVYVSEDDEHKYSSMLLECRFLCDYMNLVLLDERETLNVDTVYQFFLEYFPKIEGLKSISCVGGIIAELESKTSTISITGGELLGDLRTTHLLLPKVKIAEREDMIQKLKNSLAKLKERIEECKALEAAKKESKDANRKSDESIDASDPESSQEQIEVVEACSSASCRHEKEETSSTIQSSSYIDSLESIIQNLTDLIAK